MYRPNQTNVQTPLTSTKASHKQNLNKVGHKVRCGVVVVVGGGGGGGGFFGLSGAALIF